MSEDEIASMREALAALGRAPALMTGFGIERLTVRSELWAERLTVVGTGKATLSTLRSFGDASGEEIGRFETDILEKYRTDLVRAVEATLLGGPPANLSPGDVRLLISVVACGSRMSRVVGGGPAELEPHMPLLLALDAAAVQTRAHAKATLKLDMELPSSLPRGPQTLSLELTFRNRGREGAWIRSPSSGMEDEPMEHVRLWYAEKPRDQPGVTALPLEPRWVPLEPGVRVQRPLLWVGPGEVETRPFTAAVELDPGSYLMRASFASYAGGESVAGQNLLRGCVFSTEHAVEVRA